MEKQNETKKKEIKETQEIQEFHEAESGVSLATAADTIKTEQQFREVHKKDFEYLFNTSLNLAADLVRLLVAHFMICLQQRKRHYFCIVLRLLQ